MKVSVFSENIIFIKSALKYYKIYAIVCENDKLSNELESLAIEENIKLFSIANNSFDHDLVKSELGLIFGFGLKLSKNLINSFVYGVINFHPGCLKRYRGRHPIGWALIERQKFIKLTSHLIETDFDLGWVINITKIPIDESDTELSIIKKVLMIIKNEFLNETVNRLIKQNFLYKIESGRYLPSLKNNYDNLNSLDYESSFLIGLSKAKLDYGGFTLNKIKVNRLYKEKDTKKYKVDEFLCKDNIKLYSY